MNVPSKPFLVGMVAVLSVTAYAAYRIGLEHAQINGQQAKTTSQTESRRVLYWHDPMVPGRRFDKPGKSPYMDMPLVPVYADDVHADETSDSGADAVSIDPRVQQNLGVRLVTVTKQDLDAAVTAVGNVDYNERAVVVVQARAAGYVERLYARTPQQNVTRNQLLAAVYVPEWVAAQEDYLAIARMHSDAVASLRTAALQRMRQVGMTDEQIAAVRDVGKVQPRIEIRAPIAGVITDLPVREGMSVAMGAPLFQISALDTVWVYAEIPESQLSRVRVGARVTAEASALPGTEIHGRVTDVLPEVATTTRTAKARVELDNRKHTLLPGMFVTVRVATAPRDPVLVVPTEAVIVTGTRSVAIVAEGKGRFRPVDVVTGIESGSLTEIRQGLQEGQTIVASGQFLIDSESNLRAAVGRLDQASPSGAPGHKP